VAYYFIFYQVPIGTGELKTAFLLSLLASSPSYLGVRGAIYLMFNMRFTRRRFAESTKAAWRKWRLRVFDFFVNRWLLKALYLRILPVPVTLKVFFARE
jgi:hypothetical protein